MEKLKAEVTRLTDMELETALDKWGLNHSDHESAAVLREEIEEAHEEMINTEYLFNELWRGVKTNCDPSEKRNTYTGIYNTAVNLACEAIQAAAMARKGILSNIEIYKEDNKQNALDCAKCEDGINAACVVDGCKHKERGGEL